MGIVKEEIPSIDLEKYTNGYDADSANGVDVPVVMVGKSVEWEYNITNTGTATLSKITLKDDKEGTISCPKTTLNPGESMVCLKSAKATEGLYENSATVSAIESKSGKKVSDSDPSHYIGQKPACIGDRVWIDSNGNGIQDAGEVGIADVKVELFNEDGTPVGVDANGNSYSNIQMTDSNGRYEFCTLKPNKKYHIKVTPPEGYYFSFKAKGGDESRDSDIDAATKESGDILLKSGASYAHLDAGLVKPACIGDFIWEDKDANGIQEAGESGVAGVKLEIVDASGNSVVDVNGNSVVPVTTAADGKYEFCNLVPGVYQVKVTKLPENYYITRENEGEDESKDSDIASFLATSGAMPKELLESGEHNSSFDGGIFKSVCLAGETWIDQNVDGIRDANEEAVANVKVTLIDAVTGELPKSVLGESVAPIYTDSDGSYLFCNLIPGSYKVHFEKEPESNGAPYITTKGGEESKTPQFNEGGGESGVFTLISGDDATTTKQRIKPFAGFIKEICIGDLVWGDKNLNGLQDSGEPGAIDIPVYLLDANGNSVKDIYGNIVKATKTDNSGHYKFCHLKPGQAYQIKFDLPNSYMPTLQNQGDDTKDSDGSSSATIYVKKAVSDDMSYDLGIYCECDDYEVHPEEYKSNSAPALSLFGGLLALLAIILVIVRNKEEA